MLLYEPYQRSCRRLPPICQDAALTVRRSPILTVGLPLLVFAAFVTIGLVLLHHYADREEASRRHAARVAAEATAKAIKVCVHRLPALATCADCSL